MYDMKNLSKLKNLEANAPEAMKAFVAFDKAALAGGVIPVKYKELMALARSGKSHKVSPKEELSHSLRSAEPNQPMCRE